MKVYKGSNKGPTEKC